MKDYENFSKEYGVTNRSILLDALYSDVTDTGKKVKYQFWNNTVVSVVLYWGIIGMFTRIPTLEK